jgi:hypothetical protein
MTTQAERQKNKTLHGEWRTPMPIIFIDDDERSVEGRRCFRGEERDNVRVSVERVEKKVGKDIKVQRFVTLRRFADAEDGSVDLDNEVFMITGRANTKYDRIKWENGCVWIRTDVGATLQAGRSKLVTDEAEHGAAPPTDLVDSTPVAGPKKILRTEAAHRAPAPDWDTKLAEVRKVMMEQLKEVEANILQQKAGGAVVEATHGAMPPCDATQPDQPLPPFPESEQNTSLPEHDAEAEGPPQKILAPHGGSGEHGMWCCSSKQKTDDYEEPMPEARDMSEGFFNDNQVEDIIDRINDVVGIWGMSEATEREIIKPPVVAMNKLVKAAMELFMNNPLMDLLSYLMDEAMEFGVKIRKCAMYIHDHFVKPLTDALVDALTGEFECIEWIKDKVKRVIEMMSTMVSDEVVSKSVETIGDSDIVD